MRKLHMPVLKKYSGPSASEQILESLAASIAAEREKPYDPEMLYVECKQCGKPIVWEEGRTTSLVQSSDINTMLLDECCLIISDGCFDCMPEADGFSISIVRLTNLTPQDMLFFNGPCGNA